MTIPEDRLTLLMTSQAVCRVKLVNAAFMAGYLLIASVMLSWLALLNGAPLVFADTMVYATAAFKREVPGLFTAPAALARTAVRSEEHSSTTAMFGQN